MAKENLLPNLDLLLSLPQSFPVITHRHLQNSSVPKLPTYQLRSLRVTQYKRHRVMFFERRSQDGERAARYDFRVLVVDQVPYGPYVPVRQPGRAGRIWLQSQKSEGNILGALVGVPEVARENNL